MKGYALELIAQKEGFNAKLNFLREYLQAYILRVMHDEGAFRTIAFLGGTALRFLYDLPRFSEDLDFSDTHKARYTFTDLMKKVRDELVLAGYNVTTTYDEGKTVHNALIKFEGLLYDAGLSPLKSQKLSVKVEIDTNPPEGAVLKTDVINKYFPVAFLSYDLSSLLAGKTHALLSRKYTKGRDYFDLGWYLSKWKGLSPNFELLANALKQTGWKKQTPGVENWRGILADVVQAADWKKVNQDVQNFLENPGDSAVFTQANLLQLLIADRV